MAANSENYYFDVNFLLDFFRFNLIVFKKYANREYTDAVKKQTHTPKNHSKLPGQNFEITIEIRQPDLNAIQGRLPYFAEILNIYEEMVRDEMVVGLTI